MEDRTATGFSFYPSTVCPLTGSLCIQVLIAAMPLQHALYAFIPACLLCSIIFSPHSLRRESFLLSFLSLVRNPRSDIPG